MLKQIVYRSLLFCALLTAILWLAKSYYDSDLKEEAFARHKQTIQSARTLLHEHMLRTTQDIQQLSRFNAIRNFVISPSSETKEQAQHILLETARVFSQYDQLRIIAFDGQELIRIDNQGAEPELVATEKLQNKLTRYYVQEGLQLNPNEIYISPLDLNKEHGLIQTPYKPMVRIVSPILNNEGMPTALLVLNYKAAGLLNQFRNAFSKLDRAMLVNRDGFWLSNHFKENEWGWELNNTHLTLRNWHPNLWEQMQNNEVGSAVINDELFSYQNIHLANMYEGTSHGRYKDSLSFNSDIVDRVWTILVQSSKEQWQAGAVYKSYWFKVLLVALYVIVIALVYSLSIHRYQHKENLRLERLQLANFRDLYENAPIGYITLAADGMITNVNKMLLSYLGYKREDLVAKVNLKDLVVKDSESQAHDLLNALSEARTKQHRLLMKCKNGDTIVVSCNLTSRTDGIPTLEVGRCSVLDVSEQVKLENRLQHLAHNDPLTGLANRRYFDEFATHEFVKAQRHKSPISILAMDIDHFKKINDTYGHDVGDDILKSLANTCEGVIRSTDIMARFGGEEFVILMPDIDYDDAVIKANEIRETLAALKTPLSNGGIVQFTISIGVAAYSAELDTIDKILKSADMALYKAKESGRNKVC
ncbi:hypothetical protein CWE15_00475 [Aliidiomarina taiwanensis]|uniref:diguanylate cyclase n=1 Tax=Aliidiomarina taiwanensis TaxID=946228 RepID=A0A432X8J1_9GAMM|nr:sensor domain-containing diguanylate cyclase [Aliidiomarina taiwanensis]RUO43712.1 hypothetical protein CWE15_00475 [Aliidiomarina taiwanensis]